MPDLPQLRDAIAAATETLRALSSLEPQMAQAADVIDQCLRAGNKLLVCGNGGSAADASHFATELVVRFAKDRRALPAICLTSDSGILTAAGNDYGFDEVFARQVAAFGIAGDVLICLTTSGKSKNLIRALEEAKARKLKTIAFLGRDGGSTIGIADIDLLVKSDSTARVQEAHQLLLHVLCEIIESRHQGTVAASLCEARGRRLQYALVASPTGDGYRLLRIFQQPFALAIQLPPLARGEASNSKLGNFVEDRID